MKLLRHFSPSDEWVLEPGDLLYLPPNWGHDGVAEGPCMTASIGFRTPGARDLARALLQGVADAPTDGAADALYRDPPGGGTTTPARIVPALQTFARAAWRRATRDPRSLECALGQWLTEPKPQVWFQRRDDAAAPDARRGLRLDRRSRMLYDAHHLYLNGEALRLTGREAQSLRRLADARELPAPAWRGFGVAARKAVRQWWLAGWIHEQ